MNKILVLTHDNCVDGCCSRAILESHYGDNAIYMPITHIDYDKNFPEKHDDFLDKVKNFKNTEIIMSDICLTPTWIDFFLNNNNKVTILDHHDTAIDFMESYEKRIENGEKLNLEIKFSKDNSQSGALITWNHIHPNVIPPAMINYVSEGDTWKYKSKNTKPFYAGLLDQKEPNDYNPQQWLELINNNEKVDELIEIGKPIYDQYMKEVNSYVSYAVPITLCGKKGVIVAAPLKYRSELGNVLNEKHGGFSLIYEEKNGIVNCSLRSITPIIVNDIAKKFNGGGHKQAAAFRVKSFKELQNILLGDGNELEISAKKVRINNTNF